MGQAGSDIARLMAAYDRFVDAHPQARPVDVRNDSLLLVVVWGRWIRVANFAMLLAAVGLATIGVWPAIFGILTFTYWADGGETAIIRSRRRLQR